MVVRHPGAMRSHRENMLYIAWLVRYIVLHACSYARAHMYALGLHMSALVLKRAQTHSNCDHGHGLGWVPKITCNFRFKEKTRDTIDLRLLIWEEIDRLGRCP